MPDTAWTFKQVLPAMAVLSAAPVLVMLTWLATRGLLPQDIPHAPAFTRGLSSPESPSTVAGSATSLAVVEVAVVWLVLAVRRRASIRWLNFAVLFVWIGPAMAVATMTASVGASNYDEAAGRWWAFYLDVVLLVTGLTMFYRMVKVPRVTLSPIPLPSSTLDLRDGERAVWTGSATNRWRLLVGLLVIVTGAAFATQWPVACGLCLFGLQWANGSALRLVIDRAGVHVRRRWTPGPIRHLELDTIASAEETRHLNGWQEFRRIDTGKSDPREAQLRLRAGSAIKLLLHDETTCSISVDHAGQAADVVNALIIQARQSAEIQG